MSLAFPEWAADPWVLPLLLPRGCSGFNCFVCPRMFETQIRSYQGDDPLDPWDRYLQWVEGAFPLPSGQEHLSALLEQLVKVFIGYKRYHQDTRFVKHCIKLAEFISSPSQFFDFIYSQGVGTRTSGLYIAWAQQLETEGNMQHAGAVLQKGIHNQAEPIIFSLLRMHLANRNYLNSDIKYWTCLNVYPPAGIETTEFSVKGSHKLNINTSSLFNMSRLVNRER
uniref:BUB1 N-terminal domain-containing protein n=1 Tax=Pelusios castaneus TaxID=367368 RepID=A0A8C8S368_9SAUR